MEANHLQGWYCENARCVYNKHKQELAAKRLSEMAENQVIGRIGHYELDDRCRFHAAFASRSQWKVANPNPVLRSCVTVDDSENMDDDDDTESMGDNTQDGDANPAADLRAEDLDNSGDGAEQDLGMDVDEAPAAVALAGNAPGFDDQTTRRINELMATIATRAPQSREKAWFSEEEELLTLLRGHRMSHSQISGVS